MNASHEGAKEGWETKRPALHEREYGGFLTCNPLKKVVS